jgi:hypothetical protein
MRLEPLPGWGRAGATVCNDCTLRQMPADYTGSFPTMALQLPAVEHIGTDAEFCAERRSPGTVVPGPSVTGELSGVGALAYVRHGTDCAPSHADGVCLTVGSPKGGRTA